MSDEQKSNYPIMYGRVGSIVKKGKIMVADVLQDGVTKFKSGGEGKTFMSGRSNYVQSKEMNKGSFGVSGSYGISGISKVEASVGGYAGKAIAIGAQSMTVYYNAYLSSGIEYLDVNNLNIIDLINSMTKNPKAKMLEIINNFNDVMNQINGQDLENLDISVFEKWMKSVDEFKEHYGESLVVAVHWGAFGSVKMTMSNTDSAQQTNYGAEGNFSYSNVVASVSVKGSYDGNNSNTNAGVKVDVHGSFKGSSISTIIDGWVAKAQGKSFDELANVKMLAEVPPLKVPAGIIPKVPPFVEPIETPAEVDGKMVDKPVTESIKKVKDLEGLKSFSLSSLFGKLKKKIDPAIGTIGDLIKSVGKSVNTTSLDNLLENGQEIKLDNLIESSESQAATSEPNQSVIKESSHDAEFVPLGLLTCGWTEFFPWLATGFDNRLEDLKNAQELLNWRSMIQDCISLSSTYQRVEDLKYEARMMKQIKESFATAAEKLQNKESFISYKESMSAAFDGLTPKAKLIYKVWLNNPILRKGELGFGIVAKNVAGTKYIYSSLDVLHWDKDNKWDRIDFDQANPSVFSSFVKFYPVILPNEKIYAFSFVKGFVYSTRVSQGNTERVMDLYQLGKDPLGGAIRLTEFVVDKPGKCLKPIGIGSEKISLYPIPFKAAEGITWKGSAAGASTITSFSDLSENIESLKRQLSSLNNFSLSSNNFENISWRPDIGLSDLNVKTQYVGIIPEQKDLMRLF